MLRDVRNQLIVPMRMTNNNNNKKNRLFQNEWLNRKQVWKYLWPHCAVFYLAYVCTSVFISLNNSGEITPTNENYSASVDHDYISPASVKCTNMHLAAIKTTKPES